MGMVGCQLFKFFASCQRRGRVLVDKKEGEGARLKKKCDDRIRKGGNQSWDERRLDEWGEAKPIHSSYHSPLLLLVGELQTFQVDI